MVFFKTFFSSIFGLKVFALVGPSGTGKSFRAKLVADKYKIKCVIDDGLLIFDDKIIAGKSAKKESSYFNAIKTAIFEDLQHRQDVINALADNNLRRILILGTSVKMVSRICNRLNLPQPFKIIYITEIATDEEIETALENRKLGKHIIPVPPIEIEKKHPALSFNTIKILFKENPLTKQKSLEKTVVQPDFFRNERKK